jgi:hypothetical protein
LEAFVIRLVPDGSDSKSYGVLGFQGLWVPMKENHNKNRDLLWKPSSYASA